MTRLYFQPIQLSSIAYMDIFILIWVINCINCGQQLKVSLSIIIVNPLAAVKPKSNPIRGQPTWRNLPGATCPAKQWRDFVFNFIFHYFCCCISILRVTKEAAAHFYDGDMQQNWILWMPRSEYLWIVFTQKARRVPWQKWWQKLNLTTVMKLVSSSVWERAWHSGTSSFKIGLHKVRKSLYKFLLLCHCAAFLEDY